MEKVNKEHHNTLKTKIGILGIGAIGSVIAHHLRSNPSNKLFYFSRTQKEHLKLKIDDISIDSHIYVDTIPSRKQQLDWLFICLKEHQYVNAKSWFLNLISPEIQVVVIRNGLNLKTPLLNFTKNEHILESIIDCPTQINDEGFYHCLRTPTLMVPKGNMSKMIKSLFTSKIQINAVEDFKTESWKKLCESAALGGILCTHNDTCRILANQAILLEYKNLLNECIEVARADGAKIEHDFIERMLKKTMNYPPNKGSSMLTDMRLRKTIELGAKNGIISQIGRQYQIATPINDSVINLLQ